MRKGIVTLKLIEAAIKANCVVDRFNTRRLSLQKYVGTKNRGIGRLLFIHFAIQAGYSREEICHYIGMLPDEYYGKLYRLDDYYEQGKSMYEARMKGEESALFFYRKLKLVENHLRTMACYSAMPL